MAVRWQIVFARAEANLTHQSNRPGDCILNLESVVPRQAEIVARTGDQAGMDLRSRRVEGRFLRDDRDR